MAHEIKLIPLHIDSDHDEGYKAKSDHDLTGSLEERPADIAINATAMKKPPAAVRTYSFDPNKNTLLTPPAELEDDEKSAFPEGGTEAYLVVFGGFCALTMAFGIMNTIGVIQAYVSENILVDTSASSVGWIFSVFFFFGFGGGIYAGPIFDFKGAKIPMYAGSACIFAGLMATASCTEVYQFVLAFGVVTGVGCSFLMNCCISAVSHFFLRRRATALGICSIAGSIGGVVWPLMLRSLFPKLGYLWTMRILAFISLIFTGSGCFFVKHRITKRIDSKHKIDVLKNSFVVKDLFTDMTFFCLTVSTVLSEFALIIVVTYLTSYTLAHGNTESSAFLVIIVLNAVGAPGRYFPNFVADRYGNMNVMCICSIMCTVAIFVVWLPFGQKLGSMLAFASLFGFFSSSTLSLTPVCCGQISETEDFGKRYGTVYFLVAFGNLVSLPIGGAIIGAGSDASWNHLIIFTGAINALSAVFWLITRYLLAGTKLVKI